MSPRLAATIQVLASRIGREEGVGTRGWRDQQFATSRAASSAWPFFRRSFAVCASPSSGIPARGALTFLVFVLCLMRLGPGLILVPVIVWAWFSWPTSMAFAFTVVAIPITVADNVLKPILMSRTIDPDARDPHRCHRRSPSRMACSACFWDPSSL